MSPVVEDACLEDDDSPCPVGFSRDGVNHTGLGATSHSLKAADNQCADLQQPIDFDAPEMSGWRINPSQSNWEADVHGSPRDDGDEDVARILSMDVNPAPSLNHRTFYY